MRPIPKIEAVRAVPVRFPLRGTFRTALGRKRETRNVVAVVECSAGLRGYGEASASLAMPEATQESMVAVLRRCGERIRGSALSSWHASARRARRLFPGHPTAVSALECALLDAFCRWEGTPLTDFFGGRDAVVETYYTLPALAPAACAGIARRLASRGFRKFKVKVAGERRQDRERILAAAESARGTPLIVDANQAWERGPALECAEWLARRGIPTALIEQPLPRRDLAGLAFVKRNSPIKIAVDESLRSLSDARRIVEKDAADVFNIKVSRMGLLPAIETARYAKRMGKKLMIGCMMESRIGLSVSAAWALGSGDFEYADLDSFLLLKEVPVRGGFENRGPYILSGRGVGSGIEFCEGRPQA